MALVKNESKGYGYNYASLQDINKQGFEIPKMKVEVIDGKEFVDYYDKELNQWVQGAEIVVPESPKNKEGKDKMNIAQLYGAALTYARRYTTLMALGLSCGDDNDIENLDAEGNKKQPCSYDPKEDDGEPATEKQKAVLKKQSQAVIDNIINHYGLNSIDEISKAQAKETISKMLEKKNG